MSDIEALTNRVIVIGKGKKLYDGSLSGIKKSFNNNKKLEIVYKNLKNIPKIKYTKVNSKEKNKIILDVDMKNTTISNVIKEYTKDQQIPYLLRLMRYMGMLKRASYARFGRGDKKCLEDSLNIKNSFSKKASEIRDIGDPVDIIYE